MNKKILSIAIMAMSFATFGAMAQNKATAANNNANNAACPVATCAGPAECADPACAQPRKGDKAYRCPAWRYDGINLTADQKEKLQQLDAKRDAQRQERMKAAKADRQANDSLRFAQRRADRKEYLQEVKKILGPDQYVVYLENIVLSGAPGNGGKAAPARKHHGDKAFQGKRHHGDKASFDRKAQRSDKNASAKGARPDRKEKSMKAEPKSARS